MVRRLLRLVRRSADTVARVGETGPSASSFPTDKRGALLQILITLGPVLLVIAVYSVVAMLFPGTPLVQWLKLHLIAVMFAVFMFILSLLALAYLCDDGWVE